MITALARPACTTRDNPILAAPMPIPLHAGWASHGVRPLLDKPHGKTTNAGPGSILRSLRHSTASKAAQFFNRGSCLLQKEEVLRSEVHGQTYARPDQSYESGKQPTPINANSRPGLLSVRSYGKSCRSSQGRKPAQQRSVEPRNFVRFLPHETALGGMEENHTQAHRLQVLRSAGADKRILPKTLVTSSQERRPSCRQAIQRTRKTEAEELALAALPRSLGPGSARSDRVRLLAAKANRVGRIRGYGNSIIPQLAAEFIKVAMEIIDEDMCNSRRKRKRQNSSAEFIRACMEIIDERYENLPVQVRCVRGANGGLDDRSRGNQQGAGQQDVLQQLHPAGILADDNGQPNGSAVSPLAGWSTPRASEIGRRRSQEAIAKARLKGGSVSLEDQVQLVIEPPRE